MTCLAGIWCEVLLHVSHILATHLLFGIKKIDESETTGGFFFSDTIKDALLESIYNMYKVKIHVLKGISVEVNAGVKNDAPQIISTNRMAAWDIGTPGCHKQFMMSFRRWAFYGLPLTIWRGQWHTCQNLPPVITSTRL